MPGQHREREERYFRSGEKLREALVQVYDELRLEFVRETGALSYSAVDNAVRWELRENGMDLHEALARLDETGAAPKSVFSTLERWPAAGTGRIDREAMFSVFADWQGLEGFRLEVDYEGVLPEDVQAFGAAIRRSLSHHGRAEPYEPLQLDSPDTASRAWWNSPVIVGVVAAALGSAVTYVLQKLFG
ncbi:hypothetical protein SAMN02800687_2759 [Curtobacterium sp. UNCCL20]|uniref:hypothetical protein n=1 Tax=Curtobacterium sp. UNCCL20 TaxID=1502773 RepID=UPI000889BF15|nr:hypothetical protein [Curtobacterium sp. UNCCL20]SDQ83256.1 hypothetical protein SAMN02800687_2759 [Curtobacterium sp. UNCCL20]